MRVLVTGAGGYIGSRLIPRLLHGGHDVMAAFQDPSEEAQRYWWSAQTTPVPLDVMDAGLVAKAVQEVDAVYYLVHGLSGDDFVTRDRQSASIVAEACRAAGVGRIVYLSGLVPEVPDEELSDHIASRQEVERILSDAGGITVTLRAAVVLGSGSTSFEIIRQISERVPVQTLPTWLDKRVQPIAVVDVIEALVGALDVTGPSAAFDVGGTEQLPYPELLRRYAGLAGLTRPQVTIPLPSGLVGKLAGMVTSLPTSTVESLIESLRHDMVCHDDDFLFKLLPTDWKLTGIDDAISRSLADVEPETPDQERDPLGPMTFDPPWAGPSDQTASSNGSVR